MYLVTACGVLHGAPKLTHPVMPERCDDGSYHDTEHHDYSKSQPTVDLDI